MAKTLVCFHAHPDDEALLTAGVMAKAAADGHRVVLVVATRGDVGQVAGDFLGADEALADRRWFELEHSTAILGVARLEWLGYADSGSTPVRSPSGDAGEPDRAGDSTGRSDRSDHDTAFVDADVEQAAALLAAILDEEHADVLTSYDPNGGYGHPDHLQVHRVGARAGELAGTPIVLEATIDRGLMRMGVELAQSLGFELPPNFAPNTFDTWYTPTDELTHTIDVRDQLEAKRASMAAHSSQATAAAGDTTRSLEVFLTLPPEYFELAFGTEWFVDRSRPGIHGVTDIFDPSAEPG